MNTVDSLKEEKQLLSKEFAITYAGFYRAALIYLSLPVVIFFIGYLKPLWAIVFGLGLLGSVAAAMHSCKDRSECFSDLTADKISFKTGYIIFISVLILILLFISGISEFVFSMEDHRVRYAILNDLVEYKWPVTFDFSAQADRAAAAHLGSVQGVLSYYFTFWMIPALVGKLFGLLAARIALLIWSSIGIFLVMIGVSFMYKRASKVLFIALMLFAGLDVIPYIINVITQTPTTWEGWTSHLSIHGNYYQLMNVFNQSIPGWIITILLVTSANVKAVGLLGALMFSYSPWATIGIFPMCVCKVIMSFRGKKAKERVKELLTPGNILAPIACLILFGALYTANPNATGENGLIWKFYDSPLKLIWDYCACVIFEFGIWFLLIYKKHRKDPLLWTALITLLVLPVYKITSANDFLMRGSMAPMFLISLYTAMLVTDSFEICRDNSSPKKAAIRGRVVLALMMVSAYTTYNHLLTIPVVTVRMYSGDEEFRDEKEVIGSFGNIRDEEELQRMELYVCDPDDTVFFRYFAK